MTAPAAPASSRWLFGPVPDLLLGCGLAYAAVFVALSVAGPEIRAMQPAYLLPLMILLTSMPHYGGTLLRVYEQREDRRAYTVFAVWATIAVFALFVTGVHNAYIGTLMFTVYLTWSPWHYTGQNYGLAVMFLRRRGVALPPGVKRWVYSSFLLSYALTFLVMHLAPTAGYDPLAYAGGDVVLLPLGIPGSIGDVLVPLVGGAYLTATAVAAVLLLRRGSARDLLPAGLLVLTQALWFSGPFAIRYFGWHTGLAPLDQAFLTRDYVLWTFVGHGVQYLWVTTYYARAAQNWHGYRSYLFKAVAAGIAIWTLPFVVFAPGRFGNLAADTGLALVVAAAVNLHHFILDGAIWKLRNTRIASVLIRSQESHAATAAGGGWLRPAIWGLATAGLVIGVFEFEQTRIALPRAMEAQDWDGARATLDRLAWVGYDRANRRSSLGKAYDRAGDLDAAAAQYRRSGVLRPTPETLSLLGWTEERRGRHAQAEEAYRQALTLDAGRADMFHAGLARVAHAEARDTEAIEHYREALRVKPNSPGYANALAWILATSPDPGARNPGEAIRLSQQVLEGLEKPNPEILGTLAASYAAAGRYPEAVDTASQAVTLADSAGNANLRRRLEAGLARYRASQPYVENAALRGS